MQPLRKQAYQIVRSQQGVGGGQDVDESELKDKDRDHDGCLHARLLPQPNTSQHDFGVTPAILPLHQIRTHTAEIAIHSISAALRMSGCSCIAGLPIVPCWLHHAELVRTLPGQYAEALYADILYQLLVSSAGSTKVLRRSGKRSLGVMKAVNPSMTRRMGGMMVCST